jgi:hypothetical protein
MLWDPRTNTGIPPGFRKPKGKQSLVGLLITLIVLLAALAVTLWLIFG